MTGVRILTGDCLAVLPTLPADSVDACVTDPPYHLASIVKRFGKAGAAPPKGHNRSPHARAARGFMGQTWDGGDVAMRPDTWGAVLRVLKPGAHMIVSCGEQTEHRVACAIEDAGFEIRHRPLWLYGSGFPKGRNLAKDIDRLLGVGEVLLAADDYQPVTDAAREWAGYNTALKPAVEIGVLARKPLSEPTVAANLLRWGTGAINIDGCRVPTDETTARQSVVNGTVYGRDDRANVRGGHECGRWPANVAHDGSPEVLAAFALYGDGRGAAAPVRGTEPSSPFANVYGDMPGRAASVPHDAPGSAARFFYSAKADAGDRLGSKHPTVKPVDLVRWWVRMITPPGGTVIDPFAGSGTTGQAALAEGCKAILIEREAEYVADIERRIGHVSGADTPLFGGAA